MRKVILGLGISIDGYIARLNGAVDYSMAPFFATIDTAVMGRKTVDAAKGASFGGSIKTYVFSRSRPSGEREGVTFVNESPESLVGELPKRTGKNIWMMGGGELGREFLKADLAHEIYLGIVPTLLGEGIPLFPSGFPQRNSSLIENKSYSRGMIALRYARKRGPKKTKA
jgi:dihydrofolate reductase